jgi:glycogen debranching enzyme
MDQLVTREGDLFQVSDRRGDFVPEAQASGLFLRDTRMLSRLELLIDGEKPGLLSATAADNYLQKVYSQSQPRTDALFYRTSVAVQRRRLLHGGVMYERILLTNRYDQPQTIQLTLRYGADFADLFEVRGIHRRARGEYLPPAVAADRVRFAYRGLDQILRETELRFAPAPETLTDGEATWTITIAPRQEVVVEVTVVPAEAGRFPEPAGYEAALAAMQSAYAGWMQTCPVIESDHVLFNRILQRSLQDLRVLTSDRGYGPFPVAGIPWFAVPFGRDSLITALETLMVNPDLARGTLRTLAALQGTKIDPQRVEEPGKIAHELRFGEMANLDEVPFGRYYGTVDATPLFLVLMAEYYNWTGDLELVRELLPNIKAALDWIDTYGDLDGDGFLEYRSDQGLGLHVQSWKDSHNSMTHRDGRAAESPVAVSEVQGYAYDAKRRLAPILAKLGETQWADRLTREAEALKARFNQAFWMEDRQFMAIALDGHKDQVGTVSSDIGHCLWSGIIDEAKAPAVARRLVAPDMFSGWGIRTLSSEESSYDPASYHNGSVWPHDNALCVLGLRRAGFDAEANRVISGLIDAAGHFPYFRLPELFCGFSREEGEPVDYPVACSPQAWAAATPFALVQAMLGLEPDAGAGVLRIRPSLPESIGRLAVKGLRVGGAVVDIEVTHRETRATVRQGTLRVLVEPAATQA